MLFVQNRCILLVDTKMGGMNMKRIISLILALCMVLTLVPANVLAVEWPQAATRVNVPQRRTDAPQLVAV